jgi:hypothetical protein
MSSHKGTKEDTKALTLCLRLNFVSLCEPSLANRQFRELKTAGRSEVFDAVCFFELGE